MFPKLSYGRLCVEGLDAEKVVLAFIFEEWAKDYGYYERLLDGNPDAEALFAEYWHLMDQEALS